MSSISVVNHKKEQPPNGWLFFFRIIPLMMNLLMPLAASKVCALPPYITFTPNFARKYRFRILAPLMLDQRESILFSVLIFAKGEYPCTSHDPSIFYPFYSTFCFFVAKILFFRLNVTDFVTIVVYNK